MKTVTTFLIRLTVAVALLALVACGSDATPDSNVEERFVEIQNPTTLTLKVEGMTCNGCVNSIESALTKLDAVAESEVSLARKEAAIVYDAEALTEAELIKTIADAGYQASLGE